MIDPGQVNRHPASLLAASHLRRAGLAPDGQTTPLLQLCLEWLRAQRGPAAALLLERAGQLQASHPAWAAGLLAGNYQELEADLEQAPEGREWEALAPHLRALAAEIGKARSAGEAGRLLAENLLASLRVVYPSFSLPGQSN